MRIDVRIENRNKLRLFVVTTHKHNKLNSVCSNGHFYIKQHINKRRPVKKSRLIIERERETETETERERQRERERDFMLSLIHI